LFQPRPVPAIPFVERVRIGAGRRTLSLGLAVLIEALILLLLLTLGREKLPGVEDERPTVVSLVASEIPEEAPARRPEPEQRAQERPETQQPEAEEPRPPQPAQPAAAPAAPAALAIVPMRWELRPPAALPRNAERPGPPARPLYGPADNRSAALRDTERVGTAPNGEPLYAAQWYREPADDMMRAYLSTARGPGWGLIACRTAPDYRVEDCVALDEYPEGSQINRSVLAAAWEFRVRPPRRGGQPLVGSWVRIRIDYGLGRH
jgi:protein TonB